MGTLDDQLAALRAARASGMKSVQFGERRVEYRSDSELAAAIADLERQLAANTRPRVTYVTSSKGI